MKNLDIWKSWCEPILLKLPWSCSRAPPPQKKLSTSHRFKMTCRALHRLVVRVSVKEKGTQRVFFGGSETAPWKFQWHWCASGISKARIRHAWTITKRTMWVKKHIQHSKGRLFEIYAYIILIFLLELLFIDKNVTD